MRGVSSRDRRAWHERMGDDVGRGLIHAVIRTRGCCLGCMDLRLLQDSEFAESFVHDGEPLPPDPDSFGSAGDNRVLFNAQSVPEFAPVGLRILVKGGLPSAQLDDRSGDPLVQQGEVLGKLRE